MREGGTAGRAVAAAAVRQGRAAHRVVVVGRAVGWRRWWERRVRALGRPAEAVARGGDDGARLVRHARVRVRVLLVVVLRAVLVAVVRRSRRAGRVRVGRVVHGVVVARRGCAQHFHRHGAGLRGDGRRVREVVSARVVVGCECWRERLVEVRGRGRVVRSREGVQERIRVDALPAARVEALRGGARASISLLCLPCTTRLQGRGRSRRGARGAGRPARQPARRAHRREREKDDAQGPRGSLQAAGTLAAGAQGRPQTQTSLTAPSQARRTAVEVGRRCRPSASARAGAADRVLGRRAAAEGQEAEQLAPPWPSGGREGGFARSPTRARRGDGAQPNARQRTRALRPRLADRRRAERFEGPAETRGIWAAKGARTCSTRSS